MYVYVIFAWRNAHRL